LVAPLLRFNPPFNQISPPAPTVINTLARLMNDEARAWGSPLFDPATSFAT
jgi:hypothetical protein